MDFGFDNTWGSSLVEVGKVELARGESCSDKEGIFLVVVSEEVVVVEGASGVDLEVMQ